jgi:hypothetical protein
MLDRTDYHKKATAAVAALVFTFASLALAVSPAVPGQSAPATLAQADASVANG